MIETIAIVVISIAGFIVAYIATTGLISDKRMLDDDWEATSPWRNDDAS